MFLVNLTARDSCERLDLRHFLYGGSDAGHLLFAFRFRPVLDPQDGDSDSVEDEGWCGDALFLSEEFSSF